MKKALRERRNSYPENFFKKNSAVATENVLDLEALKRTSPVSQDSLADILNRKNEKQAATELKLQSWQARVRAESLKTMPIAEEGEDEEDDVRKDGLASLATK